MEFKYLFYLIMSFLGLLNTSSARPQSSSLIITTGEKKDVKNNKNDDFKDVREALIGNVNPEGLLRIPGDRNDDTSEDVISSGISTASSYKHDTGIEISELDSQSDDHFKNVRTPSYKTNTDALQTGNRRIPLNYYRREKRSTQHFSSLLPTTTVQIPRSGWFESDLITAVARANDLTFRQLRDIVAGVLNDRANKKATLIPEPNSGYSGSVTIHYYY